MAKVINQLLGGNVENASVARNGGSQFCVEFHEDKEDKYEMWLLTRVEGEEDMVIEQDLVDFVGNACCRVGAPSCFLLSPCLLLH